MKRIIASALALTMAIGAAGAASAQPYGGHDHNDRHGYDSHHDYRGGHDNWRGWHDRSDWRRGGYMSHSDWNRGRVVDYHRYHLRQPPRGYQWRQVDGRYVLAAITTGIIADIIIKRPLSR